jgi:hypothetical protein
VGKLPTITGNRRRLSGVYSSVRRFKFSILPALVLCGPGCGTTLDLTKAVRIESVTTGWYETNASEGQIKLVPAIGFKLKNLSDQTLRTVQVNAVFKRISEDTEWGSGFRTVAGSAGLSPATTTDRLFVVSTLGYTGTESRFDMLKNSHFIDARVEIFAKYAASTWTRIAQYQIARQLIDP